MAHRSWGAGGKKEDGGPHHTYQAILGGMLVLLDWPSPCRCEGACNLFNSIHLVVVAMSVLSLCIGHETTPENSDQSCIQLEST